MIMEPSGNGLGNERGSVLLVVLLITMAAGVMALAAVTMVGNATIINVYEEQQAKLQNAADAGIALGRVYLNENPELFPDSGYIKIDASKLPLLNAAGEPLTGIERSVYVGPTGVATGQYGVFGSIVVVTESPGGSRVVRRGAIAQESFSKYAYFTDTEGAIWFGGGDQIFGPVHSNDQMKIYGPGGGGVVFHGPVTTSENVYDRYGNARFRQGVDEGVKEIKMPELAELSKLEALATAGNTAINSTTWGSDGEASTRIEFIAIDIDGDGVATGENEGFFKVYKVDHWSNTDWLVAGVPSGGLRESENCGHRESPHTGKPTAGKFYSAKAHDNDPYGLLDGNSNAALHSRSPRCYLGGSDSISNGFVAEDGKGKWVKWSGSWSSAMPSAISSRPDADYLFPLGRAYNPNFKGVIYVDGKVAISGVLRGRVTLAATHNIIIADDVSYATDPAAPACDDILGVFAGGDIVVADNSINSPVRPNGGAAYRSYDSTTDEVIHGVLLTLESFTVEDYAYGSDDDERCEGVKWGRGCLYVTGGIIQGTRGAVGLQDGHGYIKRYSYDQCAYTNPPPYFPMTGHFAGGRYFEVDPTGFEIGEYFDRLTAG
ncbi:MAG TPA: hypothetical protein VFI91_02350 [Longimicrobiaceae bacterium]|nr:hypothetical protein [Longimicrobiaceae bacterium]